MTHRKMIKNEYGDEIYIETSGELSEDYKQGYSDGYRIAKKSILNGLFIELEEYWEGG